MAKKLKTFRLSDEVIKILQNLAEKNDRSLAYIIEMIVKEYDKKIKSK